MATRADFYVGRGTTAKWLASVAFDGYPEGIEPHDAPFPKGEHLFDATTEQEFRERLEVYLAERSDVTLPADGWPWPWDNSQTTDYAYAFDGGSVYGSCFGGKWFDPREEQDEDDDDSGGKVAVFPDMKNVQNVTLGKRSGVIVITAK